MPNDNVSAAGDKVKEGLGKLASPSSESPAESPPNSAVAVTTVRWLRVKTYAKRSTLVLLGIFIVAFGIVSGVYLSNPNIRHIVFTIFRDPIKSFGSDLRPDPSRIWIPSTFFPPDKRKSLTVLLLGSDHDTVGKRVDGHNAVPVPVANAPGRSDAIMLAKFEFDGDSISSVNILSIPRDTRVRVPGHGIHKINAAHAYGGPELACATVRDLFGIDPDYYVDLNFEGFRQVVDSIGGVDLAVHEQLDYDDNWGNLHIHLKPGYQHLTGSKAMGYVRYRHTDNDLMRAQRQHEFLEALRGKVTSPSSFLSLPNAVSAVTDNLHSNLSLDQMLTLANLARKAPKDAITLDTLPVIQGKTFVYIDRRKSIALVRKMFFKDNQLTFNDIKTPDADVVPTRRRKSHSRDGAPQTDVKQPRANAGPKLPENATGDVSEAPTSAPSANPQHDTEVAPKSDAPPKSDKQPSSDPPKSENSSGSDGGKSPSTDKGETGTSSASSVPIRG
jgi:LCP family protein required for cell wall assembly